MYQQGKKKAPVDHELLQRVQLLMAKKCVGSVARWAKELGIPQPTLNKKIRGDENFNADQLMKILAMYPDVSADWLILGKGDMNFENPVSTSDELKVAMEKLEKQAKEIERLSHELEKKAAQIEVLLDEKVASRYNK